MITDKLKKFWNNPYWAPVTEPMKNVAKITYAPLGDFIDEVKRGWDKDRDYRGGTRLGRIMSNLSDSTHAGTFFISLVGVKHHIQQKNAPKVAAATAAVAAVAPAQPSVNERVSTIVNDFMNLPQQSREALFTELERMSGDPARYPAEKMVTAIQKMPDTERVAVIEKLQVRLSADFGTVAAKQALAAQEDKIEVYKKPIRLRNKNKTPAAAGGE